jgi:hypothetical protein
MCNGSRGRPFNGIVSHMAGLHRTKGTYASFAHRHLWDSAMRHLRLAEANPEDSWHLHLSAAFLAAVAFEAYLNFLGDEMLPHVWKDERIVFTQEPYRGTMGKLKRIAEELCWPLPRRDRKPLSGYCELVALRDKVAHARQVKVEYRKVHRDDQFPSLPRGWLEAEAPPKRVRRLISDVEALASLLHAQVMQSDFRYVVFGSHPFLGALAIGTRHVEAYG